MLAPYWGAVVRLTDPSELDAFRTAVDELVPDELVVYQTLEATRPKLERAISPGAVTLLAFGLVAAGLGLLLVGQAISRRLQLDAVGQRRARRPRDDAAGAVRGGGAPHRRRCATAGAVVGGVVAWLLSPSRAGRSGLAASSPTPDLTSTRSSSGSAWRSRSCSSWGWRRRSRGATPG